VSTTGLATTPEVYRARLEGQTDDQIDAWVGELMRDLSIRRGVREVLGAFCGAARLDEASLERVYAAGDGPAGTFGRTASGEVMVPAIALRCLVPGLRRERPAEARGLLIDYLVASFHEIAYT